MNCPDNFDAFDRHDAEQERAEKNWLRKLPVCSECGKKIRDDECYLVGGDLFCEECIEDCKVYTENHMEE